jgi:hypothetical protein
MATLLDTGLLEYYVPLFSFIFIFAILYALLQKTKLLGGKSAVDFMVSLMITILVVLNSSALELANFMTTWSVVVVVILVFMVLMFFAWAKDGKTGLPASINIQAIIFWAFVIILAIGLTKVFGPVLTPYAENAPKSWVVLRTLFHPRVLGALLLLLIVNFVVKVLGSSK